MVRTHNLNTLHGFASLNRINNMEIYITVYSFCPSKVLVQAGSPLQGISSSYVLAPSSKLKPSPHSTIFVDGNRDLVFCRQRRKRISSIFDNEDRRQRQKSCICFPHTASFRRQRQQSSSSTTKIVLCALGFTELKIVRLLFQKATANPVVKPILLSICILYKILASPQGKAELCPLNAIPLSIWFGCSCL